MMPNFVIKIYILCRKVRKKPMSLKKRTGIKDQSKTDNWKLETSLIFLTFCLS